MLLEEGRLDCVLFGERRGQVADMYCLSGGEQIRGRRPKGEEVDEQRQIVTPCIKAGCWQRKLHHFQHISSQVRMEDSRHQQLAATNTMEAGYLFHINISVLTH